MFGKIKYKARFFIKEGNSYNLKGKKKINTKNLSEGVFKYKNLPYAPNFNLPTYRKGLNRYFWFEIGVRNQITTYESDIDKESDIRDDLYRRKVVKQFVSSIGKYFFHINWLHIVLCAIAFFCIGFFVKMYIP